MLILKPKGRGNWAHMELEIRGARSDYFHFDAGMKVGSLLTLGGIVWRICEVRP